MSYDPNKETSAERLARKQRERKEYLARTAEEEKEYQPRDDEEARNAAAEDKALEDNLNAILNQVGNMSDEQFDTWAKKNKYKKPVKKAGGIKNIKAARAKKKGCLTAAVALVGTGVSVLGGLVWSASEIVSALL